MFAQAIQFLNRSSLLVALAAASLTYEGFLLCNSKPLPWMVIQVFFFTWSGYLFLRREVNIPYQRLLLFIAIGCSILCAIYTRFFEWPLWILSGLIVLFYNLTSGKIPLLSNYIPRQTTLLKPAAVGAAWAIATSIIPSGLYWYQYDIETLMLFLSNFLFITGLAICDDIRDVEADKDDIRTLPLAFGLITSKALAIAHILLALLFFQYINPNLSHTLRNFHIIYMIALCPMIAWIHPRKNKQLQSFLIDGSILMRGVLTALLTL